MGKSFGFTLIELLVVIAVLGVLAAGVLVGIDPLERVQQAQDAGRKTKLSQIINGAISYATSHNGEYPSYDISDPNKDNWLTNLVNTGDLKIVLPNSDGTACDAGACSGIPDGGGFGCQNGYCIVTTEVGGGDAIIYTRSYSKSERAKCPSLYSGRLWFLHSSKDGQTGLICESEVSPLNSYSGQFK